MSSFSCPHLNIKDSFCIRLKTDCVPGRNGCVLAKKFQFAVPAEVRVNEIIASKKFPPGRKEKRKKS